MIRMVAMFAAAWTGAAGAVTLDGSYVIVKNEDGTQENRYVSTGIYSDEYVEILDGLSEGEQVVSTYVAKSADSAKKNSSNRGGPPPM